MSFEATDSPGLQAVIAAQESLIEEAVCNNGIKKTIHVVVKNSPFSITLALTKNGRPFYGNLKAMRVDLDTKLVYDLETEKEVALVKDRPMDVKLEYGRGIVNCEFKIKVLTTQHEGMCFRIKFIAEDEGEELFTAYTAPIKVISKSDLVKKKVVAETKHKTQKTRPSKSGNLIGMLQRIEERSREHAALLATLLQKDEINSSPLLSPATSPSSLASSPSLVTPTITMTAALRQLGNADPEDRRAAVKAVLREQEPELLYELYDVLCSAGLPMRQPSSSPQTHHHSYPTPYSQCNFEALLHPHDSVYDVTPYFSADYQHQ